MRQTELNEMALNYGKGTLYLKKHPTAPQAFYASRPEVPILLTGLLHVRFDPQWPAAVTHRLARAYGLETVELRGPGDFIFRTTPVSPHPLVLAKILQESPGVWLAEPDLAGAGRSHDVRHDPLVKLQWYLKNQGDKACLRKGADARVIDAWEASASVGDEAAVLAIIDEGFDLGHPDLSAPGKVVAPVNFNESAAGLYPRLSSPTANHGTACAGIAVGAWNATGIMGAAPQCHLMPIRKGENCLSGLEVERWFRHALHHGAWVVSCSWGAADPDIPLSTLAWEAIRDCARQGRNGLGTIICFSSGNDGRDISRLHGFANHEEVLAIGAINSLDLRPSYSNYGSPLFLCAPSDGDGGAKMLTANIHYGYLANFGGTSGACALTSGICAFLLSLRPDLEAGQLKELLKRSARRIAPERHDFNGHAPGYGFGCIDALAAVKLLDSVAFDKNNGHTPPSL